MEAADEARRRGDARRAVALLEDALAAEPRHALAAAAALVKGRVWLDDLHDPAAAQRAFAWVRAHAQRNPLAEDALALEAVAAARRGWREEAQRLATDYEQRYPQGVHRARLRSLTASP